MFVGQLLGGTGRAFEEAMGSIVRSYTTVREAVKEGVNDCKAKLLQQEGLTVGSRDTVLEMLVRGFCKKCF